MKQKLIKLLFLLCFLPTTWLIGQNTAKTQKDTVYSFTLKAAQDFALTNNVNMKNNELDIEIAKKKVWEITAIGLPQVTGSAGIQIMPDIPIQVIPNFISPAVVGTLVQNGLLPPSALGAPANPEYIEAAFGTKYNNSFGIKITQLIFDGSYIVGLQASRVYVELSKDQKKKTEIEVKETIAQTYYLVNMIKDNLAILDTSFQNIEKIADETSKIQKAGFLDETDAEQIKLQIMFVQNQRNNIYRQFILAKNALKFQLGLNMTDSLVLTESLENTMINSISENSVLTKDLDIKNHIDYKILDTYEKSAKLQLRNEKFKYLPSLVAFYNYQKDNRSQEMDFKAWHPTQVVGLSLSVPIFNSGMTHFRVQQAKLQLQKVKNSKYQVEDGLKLNIQNNRSTYIHALSQYQKNVEAKNLSEKIYKNTLKKFRAGTASSMDFTQAHTQYLSAQSQLITTMLEVMNAKSNLNKALNNY